jgi:sulfatase modifying factor 1
MLRFAVGVGTAALFLATGTSYATGAEKKAPPAKEIVGKDGAPMVLVPAGEFLMGSTTTMIEEWSKIDDCGPAKQCNLEDEFPQHPVMLDAFLIDKLEITNARYFKFVQAAKHRPPVNPKDAQDRTRNLWEGGKVPPAVANLPVVNVDWDDAKAYCEWAGRRLPTEAEWEKAARGPDGRVFPWGAEWDRTLLNSASMWAAKDLLSYESWAAWWDAKGFELLETKTLAGLLKPGGSFPGGASPYGVQDMAGNVSEWVADWAAPGYYQTSPDRNPQGPESGEKRALRGGSWYNHANAERVALRRSEYPNHRANTIGFRCAKNAP